MAEGTEATVVNPKGPQSGGPKSNEEPRPKARPKHAMASQCAATAACP